MNKKKRYCLRGLGSKNKKAESKDVLLPIDYLLYCIQGDICPSFIFTPFCPHCQRAYLRRDESQYLILFLLPQNCDWANSKLCETGCKCRWAKIAQGKNNPTYSS